MPNEFKAVSRELSGSFRRSRLHSQGSHKRSRSAVPNQLLNPISVPGDEEPQLIEEEDTAYMAKASGMGQTKNMSFVSSDGNENENSMLTPNANTAAGEDKRLIKPQQSPN